MMSALLQHALLCCNIKLEKKKKQATLSEGRTHIGEKLVLSTLSAWDAAPWYMVDAFEVVHHKHSASS